MGTANKSITKNTVLLYIRLIITIFIAFFTQRIVLSALGIEDYGIYNVVGGYSDEDKRQLLIVVDTRDYGPLISKIHAIDQDAFIITENVAKVHGGQWGI